MNDTSNESNAEAPQNPPVPLEDERETKIRELSASIEDLRRQLETAKDQLLRKAAEFENYRRRNENDLANSIRTANEGLILSLLPIVNDFVRSLTQGKDLAASDGLYRGIELIYNKLMRLLEQHGVVPFTSAGKPFDVSYHDALLQVPRADVPPHTVIEEVERGYMMHDRVLRHAKVIVSAAPDESLPSSPDNGVEGSTGKN